MSAATRPHRLTRLGRRSPVEPTNAPDGQARDQRGEHRDRCRATERQHAGVDVEPEVGVGAPGQPDREHR